MGELEERLGMLDPNLVHTSDQSLHLTESTEEGKADLALELKNPCVLFDDLEHKKLQYFCNQKCADYIMYENANGQWKLHVFELKRTVNKKEWMKMKLQFAGAVQNAWAIAGFLGISVAIEHVQVYSVYRNDKINDYVNPARLRGQMYRRQPQETETPEDWNDGTVGLELGREVRVVHEKIRLDAESGNGTYEVTGK